MAFWDFLNPIRDSITRFLLEHDLTLPPWNVIFLIAVSVTVSSLSGLISKKLIDMEELNRSNEIIQQHNKRKKKAKETADKKLWEAVEKKDKRVQDLQRSIMTKRMMPSFITFGPIIFVFSTLRAAFQSKANTDLNLWSANGNITCTNSCGVVSVMPFKIPEWMPIVGKWFSPYVNDPSVSVAGFGFFYFLTAITASTLIQKIFGINLTGMQNNQLGMK